MTTLLIRIMRIARDNLSEDVVMQIDSVVCWRISVL